MSLVPKIKLEVTFDELTEVCDSFTTIGNYVLNSKKARGFVSLMECVLEKLLKKQLAKRHTPKFNLTLEYYEAQFLEIWLLEYGFAKSNSPMQNFINKLNQKLA